MELRVEIPPGADQRVLEAARRGLIRAGEHLLAAAEMTAPYDDTGEGVHLRDTGYSRLQAADPDGDSVEVGFTAFWALWQHERMDYHHTHGRAKFLELAMVEQGEQALEIVAEHIRQAAG
jgi:hypothetical protein